MPKAVINGISINYSVDGRGEPIFLIMGFMGSEMAWFFQRRAFREQFQVVTFDNRGVGKSDKPAGPYSMQMFADDTIGLMDHLGIDKAHILGVSMGGMIAQHIALSYPERVRKLVLGCTFAGGQGSTGLSAEYIKRLGISEDASDDELRQIDSKKQIGTVIALSFNDRLLGMAVSPLLRIFAGRLATEGVRGQLEAILGHDTLERLPTIQAPTLVIVGAQDRLINPTSSDVLADAIPGARLVKIENGSHAFFASKRGRFNREVLGFLQGNLLH
jgi:pimeloyl-ACP methyl ester carboxylesterase